MLEAARQSGDRHVAGKHAAPWTEHLDRVEYPWAHLPRRPVQTEDAFQPENLDHDVCAPAERRHVTPPRPITDVCEIDRPAHQRQDELDIRQRPGQSRETGKLWGKNFDLTAKAGLAQA